VGDPFVSAERNSEPAESLAVLSVANGLRAPWSCDTGQTEMQDSSVGWEGYPRETNDTQMAVSIFEMAAHAGGESRDQGSQNGLNGDA
jgi:hypothetical protein